jgi:phage terminase large subunit
LPLGSGGRFMAAPSTPNIPKFTGELKRQFEFWKPIYMQGAAAGCPADQMANYAKAQIVLQPKQLAMAAAARRCDAPNGPTAVGVGGARGGGKSAWMFAQICGDDCQRFPGLKVLMLRKTATAMREQIRDMLLKTCRCIPHNYREQAGTIEFGSGSFVVIRHFKDEKEIENFLGQEYDVIAIEELTTLTFDKWKNLMTCLRTSKPGWRPRFYGAWNWGCSVHYWVKKIFYEPWLDNRQADTLYIKATVADNNFVNPENRKILETLTGWKYEAWYLGNPDIQAGQFFTNWRENFHVYPNKEINFDEKKAQRWFASFDTGFNHPACFLLFGVDGQGRTFTVDEYHQRETIISEHAENFRALLRRHHLEPNDLDFIAAGKDCFARERDGRTVASEFSDYGIELLPTEIDRVNAWEVMHQRLGNLEKGISPSWFIHKSCVNLIVQIPMAQCHETRMGDVIKMNADIETGDGGDDALEAARNGLVFERGGVTRFAMPVPLVRVPYQAMGFL